MRVEEIDARLASDEELRRVYEVERACRPELNPGEPPRTEAETFAFHRFQPETHTSCLWTADGGFAALYVHGPTAAFADVQVHPDRRRAGIGAALAEAVLERCRELEVVSLHSAWATPAGEAFARRFGGVDGQRLIHSVLDLRAAELPEPQLPDGWRVVTWFDHVPDEHLDAYVRARLAMDDAPTPADLDYPSASAHQVRASERSLRLREREMRLTVAQHESGEIGAFTELRVSRGSAAGFTDDTGTVAAHRGRGLARAVKVASLRLLRDDHPELVVVTTTNAEENDVMRHINRTLGFAPARTFTQIAFKP